MLLTSPSLHCFMGSLSNRLRGLTSHLQGSLCLSFAPHALHTGLPLKITTVASHPSFLTPPCLWVNAPLTPCPKVTKSLQVVKAQYDILSYLTQLLRTFNYSLYHRIVPLRQLPLTPPPEHMLNGKNQSGSRGNLGCQ